MPCRIVNITDEGTIQVVPEREVVIGRPRSAAKHPSGEFLAHSGRLARERRRADSPWSAGNDDLGRPLPLIEHDRDSGRCRCWCRRIRDALSHHRDSPRSEVRVELLT